MRDGLLQAAHAGNAWAHAPESPNRRVKRRKPARLVRTVDGRRTRDTRANK